MYETFDHTADLGLRVRAPTLDALFVEAAEALFSIVIEVPGTVKPVTRIDVNLSESDRELLLFDWLKELLYRFDAEHLVFSRFEARVRPDGFTGAAWGEKLDRDRHELGHEVKAITYHGLKVEQTAGGWLAEVIVDI
jgi:SHS2 domain-containing protein